MLFDQAGLEGCDIAKVKILGAMFLNQLRQGVQIPSALCIHRQLDLHQHCPSPFHPYLGLVRSDGPDCLSGFRCLENVGLSLDRSNAFVAMLDAIAHSLSLVFPQDVVRDAL